MWTWDDTHVCAMDYETSGTRPEYALQPWRIPHGKAWATSLVWLWPHGGKLKHLGAIMPGPELTEQFLRQAIAEERVVCGWNVPYDISVAMAYGFRDLCFKIRWLDGRLLWRHLFIEPQYSDADPRKPYGLKDYVREYLPQYAGYEEAVDFHDTSPEGLARLHHYNVQDNVYTLKGCKHLWHALTPAQQQAAWIEAACLPLVADANLRGLLIDTIGAQDLKLKLQTKATGLLDVLAPDIIDTAAARSVKGPKRRPFTERQIVEKVVASPQKLATLLFDDWGLPAQGLTDKGARSTGKETLFELAFIDPRAKQIRDYREALNCSKKFAETPVTAARYNEDGRAHPLAMVFGTYSGRFTYASKQTKRKDNQMEADGE